MDPGHLFHVGIVVPDLEQARYSIARATGHRFLPVTRSERQVETPDGSTVVPFAVSYSVDPFHLELIQAVPGTIWDAGEAGRLHHLGYWSEDLHRDAASLEADGVPVAARSERWSYHRFTDYYIELLDAAGRPAMEERWQQTPDCLP